MKNLQNKNALNIVLIALVLVVAACNCGKLQELAKKEQDSSTPTTSTPTISNSATKTEQKTDSDKADLTIEKYNKIKTGMSLKDVQDLLGSKGSEMSSSEVGKYKILSMKWEGGDYKYVYATFTNDKLQSKTQANLK